MVEEILIDKKDPKTTFEVLASKYGVSPRTLSNDWSQKDTWIKDVINQQDSELIVYQVLYNLKKIYDEATVIATQSNNQSARVSAARLKRELTMDIWRIYTELGVIKSDKSKISEEGLTHIEWLKSHPNFFNVEKEQEDEHDSIESTADSPEENSKDRVDSSDFESASTQPDT